MTSAFDVEEWISIHATLEKASKEIDTIRQEASSKEEMLKRKLNEAIERANEMEIMAKAAEDEAKRREDFALASLESLAKAALDRARVKAEDVKKELKGDLDIAKKRLSEAEIERDRAKEAAAKDRKKVEYLEKRIDDLKLQFEAVKNEGNRKEEFARASLEALAKAAFENCSGNTSQSQIATSKQSQSTNPIILEKALRTKAALRSADSEQMAKEILEAEKRARKAEVECYSINEKLLCAKKELELRKEKNIILEQQVAELSSRIGQLSEMEAISKEALESIHEVHNKSERQHYADVTKLIDQVKTLEVERDRAKNEIQLMKEAMMQHHKTTEELERRIIQSQNVSQESNKRATVSAEALNHACKEVEKMKREHNEEVKNIKTDAQTQIDALEMQRDRALDELNWTKRRLAEKREMCEKDKAKLKTLEDELILEKRKSLVQEQTSEELDRVVNELRIAAEESAREEALLRSALCAYQSQMSAYNQNKKQNTTSGSSKDNEQRKNRSSRRRPWSFKEEKKCAN